MNAVGYFSLFVGVVVVWPPMRTLSILRVCVFVALYLVVAAVHLQSRLHTRTQILTLTRTTIFSVCGLPRALADSQFVVNNNGNNNKK